MAEEQLGTGKAGGLFANLLGELMRFDDRQQGLNGKGTAALGQIAGHNLAVTAINHGINFTCKTEKTSAVNVRIGERSFQILAVSC